MQLTVSRLAASDGTRHLQKENDQIGMRRRFQLIDRNEMRSGNQLLKPSPQPEIAQCSLRLLVGRNGTHSVGRRMQEEKFFRLDLLFPFQLIHHRYRRTLFGKFLQQPIIHNNRIVLEFKVADLKICFFKQ